MLSPYLEYLIAMYLCQKTKHFYLCFRGNRVQHSFELIKFSKYVAKHGATDETVQFRLVIHCN